MGGVFDCVGFYIRRDNSRIVSTAAGWWSPSNRLIPTHPMTGSHSMSKKESASNFWVRGGFGWFIE